MATLILTRDDLLPAYIGLKFESIEPQHFPRDFRLSTLNPFSLIKFVDESSNGLIKIFKDRYNEIQK